MQPVFRRLAILSLPVLLAALTACGPAKHATGQDSRVSILNVSYDPTREFYKAYDKIFQAHWKNQTGQDVDIQHSNGGSGKQALAVRNGLKADVVTLALAPDIDAINPSGKTLINPNWQSSLPDNSTPYTSTIVFLVRKGNPKNIRDWGDLVKDGVEVITPNPKTSGGARWNFLAAWAWAKQQPGGSDSGAQNFVTKLYQHVPVMDTGARAATLSFTKRELGDVLLTWENEAFLAQKASDNQYDIITPSLSILCEPPVTVVNSVTEAKGTTAVATEYLKHLYSDDAQRLIAQNGYRPVNPNIQTEYRSRFPELKLLTVRQAFGNWADVQKHFFSDGGLFDQIYQPAAKQQ